MGRTEEWESVDDVECISATEKALKCKLIGTDRYEDDVFWVPRKCINEDESDVQEAGDLGTLVIASWKARDLGLS